VRNNGKRRGSHLRELSEKAEKRWKGKERENHRGGEVEEAHELVVEVAGATEAKIRSLCGITCQSGFRC
jgi:hypothetical protein